LRELLEEDAAPILGARAELTRHGRFPLLLKLIDAGDVLSVQVHPDDDAAHRLDEPDTGKTEMWHVLEADSGSTVICGLAPEVAAERFSNAVLDGSVEALMNRFAVREDTSIFVPAGTVHAIGGGILLAEIQQNSDLTYRLYDYNRLDAQGNPRPLHIEKGIEVTDFASAYGGPAHPLARDNGHARIAVLAACRYFAAEEIVATDGFSRALRGASFHLLLVKHGVLTVEGVEAAHTLRAGEAVMVPAEVERYTVHGDGCLLDYYVPELRGDIVEPLLRAGHSQRAIASLGGVPETSDLAKVL
jgi:mannose-6-phosphate isomerase